MKDVPGSCIVTKGDSSVDLSLKEFILEFLFTKNLATFLTSSDEVRHHSVCGPIWQVFEDFVSFIGESTCNLIGKALKLCH